MTLLHLVQLQQTSILEQLQIEEALLRADSRNWCLINEGTSPAIVMGISGQPEKLIHSHKLKTHPVPVIRRFSGGGTVFVDEQTYFVTFICNTNFIPISPFPNSIMQWSAQLYRSLLEPHPFNLQENDYVLGMQKFGGNAQSICKERWLHHSSLLWDYSPANMDYLLFPPKTPLYRQQRSHTEFLCSLCQYWPSKVMFKEALLEQIYKTFQVQEVIKEEIVEVLKRPHRQATCLLDPPLNPVGHQPLSRYHI